jgi:hypothetical protein
MGQHGVTRCATLVLTITHHWLVAVSDARRLIASQNLDVAFVVVVSVIKQAGHGTIITHDSSPDACRRIEQILLSVPNLSVHIPRQVHK